MDLRYRSFYLIKHNSRMIPCPFVLVRSFNRNPKCFSGIHRPMGVSEQFSREKDNIRLSFLQIAFCLFRARDESNSTNRKTRNGALDFGGEWNLATSDKNMVATANP